MTKRYSKKTIFIVSKDSQLTCKYCCLDGENKKKRMLWSSVNAVIDYMLNHVGDLDHGLDIPNKQLLQLDHAPLCRKCDAYHCHRCIWLNDRLTWDMNTPSHQQCVLAHLERNASRDIQQSLKDNGLLLDNDIPSIDYLDPFDVKEEW